MSLSKSVKEAKRSPRVSDQLQAKAAGKGGSERPAVRVNQWMDEAVYEQLKSLARKESAREDRNVTMRELIERALIDTYGFKR